MGIRAMRPVDSQRYLLLMPHGPLTAYQRPDRLPSLACYQPNRETFNHTQFGEPTFQALVRLESLSWNFKMFSYSLW